MQGNRQFFSEVGDDGLSRKRFATPDASKTTYHAHADAVPRRFRTSGNVVVVLTSLSVAAYITLMVLTLRLDA